MISFRERLEGKVILERLWSGRFIINQNFPRFPPCEKGWRKARENHENPSRFTVNFPLQKYLFIRRSKYVCFWIPFSPFFLSLHKCKVLHKLSRIFRFCFSMSAKKPSSSPTTILQKLIRLVVKHMSKQSKNSFKISRHRWIWVVWIILGIKMDIQWLAKTWI